MRVGGFLSVVVHAVFLAGGLVVASAPSSDPVPMVILPVELLTIAESTNVAPVSEKAKPDDQPLETQEVENVPPPNAAPPPPPEDVFVPEAATPPPPKKDAAKKSETESKGKEQSNEDVLNSILASIDKKPKQQRAASADKAANLRDVDAAPRKGYGDMKRMTITVADFIKVQLVNKGCWGDQDDLADARRLRATIRVRFGRDGHLLSQPELINPTREPSNDPVLQVFVGRARTALNKCNTLGFQVPPEYFEVQPVQYIDIEFLP